MKTEDLHQRWLNLWQAINRLVGRSTKASAGSSAEQPEPVKITSSPTVDPPFPATQASPQSELTSKPAPDAGLSPMTVAEGQEEELQWRQELLETIHEAYLKKAQESKEKRKNQKAKQKKRRQTGQMQVTEIKEMLTQLPAKTPYTMLLFIMYDIESNKVRKKVADYLEAKGLKRVQYSVFFGELDRRHYDKVKETLLDIQTSYENEDSIMVVPIAEDEFRRLHLIGKQVDFELDLMRGSTLIF